MALPLVLFPDIELWACGFLRDALAARDEPHADGVFVGIGVPETRRPRMVIVRRDGGTRLDAVRETARLTVRVYGASEQEASSLALLVRALLGSSADGKPVARVTEGAGPVPVPDEAGRPALRLMTFEMTVLGTAL